MVSQEIAIKQLGLLEKKSSKIRLAAEGWKNDFELLISTILSARTKDETTIKVAEKLFKKYPNTKKLKNANLKEVEEIIEPINFYQNKAKNIIQCSKSLYENYGGKVPHDFEKLIELRGVGRKTANVFLAQIGKDAIGVDTHVSYCSQRLNWTNNENPEKIERDLKKLFPKDYWNKINPTLVRFGKTYTNRIEKNRILDKIKEIIF